MVYNFHINNRAFKAIKDGKKKFENRVTKVDDDFDYSVIEKGDYIKLTSFEDEKMVVQVLYVHWYQSAEELLLVEGTEYTLSSTNDYNEGVKNLQRFPGYPEGIAKNGIFCIRIEPVSDVGIEKLLLDNMNCTTDVKIDEYIKYRDKIKEDMTNPEWLGDMTRDDILYLLNNDSRIWMYHHMNNFVCSMMLIPATEEDIMKFGLEYNYLDVVDYGPMMVSSKYRGNSLQDQMIKKLNEYSVEVGYKVAITTVHPNNEKSINNLINNGFILHGKCELKRGIRNIYVKELDN